MKKKALQALILAVLAITLVVCSVLGTLAFLSSSTTVTNVFTIGNVGIQMFESKVNPDGTKVNPESTVKDADANSYHLLPGSKYTKDPTIYINADSDKSYLFVKVRNTISSIEENKPDTYDTIAEQMATHGWQYFCPSVTVGDIYVYTGGGENGDTVGDSALITDAAVLSDILAKKRTAMPVGGVKAQQAIDIFDYFEIADDADVSIHGGSSIILTAYAIQTAGFVDDPDGTPDGKTAVQKAWEAIVATYATEGAGSSVNS